MYKTYEFLYRAFNLLNEHYYENELNPCMITLQKKKENNRGSFTKPPTWFNNVTNEEYYEININPLNMNCELFEIVNTLAHECVHYYCELYNLKDVKQKQHTAVFKQVAEEHGLNVEYDDDIGWSVTSLNDETIELVKDLIAEYKNDIMFMYVEKKPAKKAQYKYTCSQCGMKVYSKPDKSIICGDCGLQLEMEEIEEENIDNENEEK